MRTKLSILEEDLASMRLLKSQGYSNRQISSIFNIAKSTVWDNIYSTKNEKIILPEYRKIEIAKQVIALRKKQGYNTGEVAKELGIPLGEVNYIWTMKTFDLQNNNTIV